MNIAAQIKLFFTTRTVYEDHQNIVRQRHYEDSMVRFYEDSVLRLGLHEDSVVRLRHYEDSMVRFYEDSALRLGLHEDSIVRLRHKLNQSLTSIMQHQVKECEIHCNQMTN